jgi:hypothetical protein
MPAKAILAITTPQKRSTRARARDAKKSEQRVFGPICDELARERSQKRVFRHVRAREKKSRQSAGPKALRLGEGLDLHQVAFCLARRRRMYSAITAL